MCARAWAVGLGFAGIAVIALTLVALLLFQSDKGPEASSYSTERSVVSNAGGVQPEDQALSGHERSQEPPSESELVTVGLLETLCPDVHESTLTEECYEALDAYFIDTVVDEYSVMTINVPFKTSVSFRPILEDFSQGELETITVDLPWRRTIPIADPPTFRFVFEDPKGSRNRVATAMEREDCLPSKGKIRKELNSECATQSFTALAMLLFTCNHYEKRQTEDLYRYSHDGQNTYESEIRRVETSTKYKNLEDYHEARNRVLETGFRDAWVVEKCSRISRDVLSPIAILHPIPENSRQSSREDYRNASGGEIQGTWNWPNAQAYKDMIMIAARLGDPWALAKYSPPKPSEDPDFWHSMREESPFAYHVYMYRSTEVQISSRERIEHAILAQHYAVKMNLTYTGLGGDPQWLQTHLDEIGEITQDQLKEAYSSLGLEPPSDLSQ